MSLLRCGPAAGEGDLEGLCQARDALALGTHAAGRRSMVAAGMAHSGVAVASWMISSSWARNEATSCGNGGAIRLPEGSSSTAQRADAEIWL